MKFTQCLKLLLVAGAVSVWMSSGAMAARCGDDVISDKADRAPNAKAPKGAAKGAVPEPEVPLDPMTQLQLIAREASKRSAALGSSRLLAEAAEYDVAESRGPLYPQVSVSAGYNKYGSQVDRAAATQQTQSALSLNMSSSIYDGGRTRRMMQYRKELADAAKLGAALSQEQVVYEAVSVALERSRYKLQAQVYQQYMRKMSCLVEALESIVAQDKGRSSELVQVRKTQAQTELQRDQALAQSRQSELKLRKLIGDLQIQGESITLPLATVPDLSEINRQVEFANDARQLRVQAEAADSYVQAAKAGQRPQLNWNLGKSQARQAGTPVSSWQAGVTLTYSLFNGFTDDAVNQAALKRAQAARAQLEDLLNSKYARTAETYDIASSAFDRAKRYVDVLRDSELVRNFTFQQWAQIGKRSLFDVMSAESDHFNLRIAYVNALYDGYQASAQLRSMGAGLSAWLAPDMP